MTHSRSSNSPSKDCPRRYIWRPQPCSPYWTRHRSHLQVTARCPWLSQSHTGLTCWATLTGPPRLRQRPRPPPLLAWPLPGRGLCTPPRSPGPPSSHTHRPAPFLLLPPGPVSALNSPQREEGRCPRGQGAPRPAAAVQTIGVHRAPGARRPSQALPSTLLHPPFPAARGRGRHSCARRAAAGDGEGTGPDGGAGKPHGAESARPHLCGALARWPLAAAARRGPPPRAWPGGAPVPPSRCVRTSVPRSLRGHRPSPGGWGCQWMTSGPPRPPAPRVSVRRGARRCGAQRGGSLRTHRAPPSRGAGRCLSRGVPQPLNGKGVPGQWRLGRP